ncbi:hypothetical protein EAH79_05685 [Sphingomonas koreensis]|nr:hypothetical protein EAH79_05685 [Sphingomonas koreensis]
MLLATAIAWPFDYAAMRTWLAGFADLIPLSPLYFVAASVIAMLTALGQSLAPAVPHPPGCAHD